VLCGGCGDRDGDGLCDAEGGVVSAPVQFVMVLPKPITAHEAAAILGKLGGQERARRNREPIKAKARELREQLGLAPREELQ
jgi:hypothetical protein